MQSFGKHFIKALLMLIPAVALVAGMEMYQKYQQEQAGGSMQLGSPFTLQTQDGPFTLASDGNELNVIYFGYTQCPDICPTSMSVMSAAFNQLPADALQKVQGILISVDPERDTLEHLKTYAEYFHPQIKGMTGEAEAIRALSARYGAFYQKAEVKGSAMGYTVDHTSVFYLTNRDGQVLETVSHSASPDHLLAALKKRLL